MWACWAKPNTGPLPLDVGMQPVQKWFSSVAAVCDRRGTILLDAGCDRRQNQENQKKHDGRRPPLPAKWPACLTVLLLAAQFAPAQVNYNIIKRQARDANTASGNASQGITSPAPVAPDPADPVRAATRQNIANLTTDIAAIGDASQPDPALKLPLLNDLAAAAQGAKPATDTLRKFAGDFCTALAGHKLPAGQPAKLAQILHALLNSSHLPAAQQQALPGVLQKILEHAGVSPDTAANVAASLQTVAAQTQ